MAKKNFDYIFIGGSLESLLVAHFLKQNGRKVLVLEATESVGEYLKASGANFPLKNPFESYFSNLENTLSSLQFLQLAVGLTEVEEVQKNWQTYDSGKFKAFVGFGEKAPAFMDVLAPYLQTQKLKMQSHSGEWLAALTESLGDSLLLRHKLTEFKIEENRVAGIIVNDSKTFHAENYVYADAVKELTLLVPDVAIGKKNFQKLAKSELWTMIQMDFAHAKESAPNEEFFLLSSTADDAIPYLGTFYTVLTEQGPQQMSQWFTFIEAELTDDGEATGAVVREMKRQIKRAFPEALEEILFEKIRVNNESHGQIELKLDGDLCFPGLENLYLVSGFQSHAAGTLGKVLMAEKACAFFAQISAESSTDSETEESET